MKNLRQEFADTMIEIGLEDARLVVMVGDISHGILKGFAQNCPGRYFNIGICEPTIVNMAAGIRKTGLMPVVHTIAPFIVERAYEQIKLDFGYQRLSGNFITVGGAFDYAQLGCSHHCYADISLMCHIENSQVMMPGSAQEFRALFRQAYSEEKINYFKLTENPHEIELKDEIVVGRGIKIMEGGDITLVAAGPQLRNAILAAEKLKKDGWSVEVLYYHTLKPFDGELLVDSVEKTRNMITIEELSSHDGLFNLCLRYLNGKANINSSQIAIDGFVHGYGTYQELCEKVGLTPDNIYQKALMMLK